MHVSDLSLMSWMEGWDEMGWDEMGVAMIPVEYKPS